MNKRRLALLSIPAVLFGCATAPVPIGQSPFLETSTAPPNLLVSRPDTGSVGQALDYFLYIDGHKGPKLNRGDRLQLRVSPGRRTLTVQPFFLGTVDSRSSSAVVEIPREGVTYMRFGVAVAGFTGAIANLNFSIQQIDKSTWESGR